MSTHSHGGPAASSSMLAPSSSFRISRKPTPVEHGREREDEIDIEDLDAEDESRAWGYRSGHGLEGKRSTTTARSLGPVSDSPEMPALSSPQQAPHTPHIRNTYHEDAAITNSAFSPMPHVPGALALSSADSASESEAAADKFLSPLSVRVIQAWGSRHSQRASPTSPEATAEHEREDISVAYAPRIRRPAPKPLLEPVASIIVPNANGNIVGTGNGGSGDGAGDASRANTNQVPAPGMSSVGQALDNPVSKLSKLQSYLPTGTWITYTALQTWAFSINPDKPPPQSEDPAKQSTCNSDQRTALIAVLGLCGAAATFAPFVKNFVLDSRGERIVFPPPHAARVPHSVRDTVSGATFPYHMANGRWVWPCTSASGGWVRQGEFVRVMLFKEGKSVKVAGKRKGLLQIFGSMAKKPEVDVVLQDADGLESVESGFGVPEPVPWWKWNLRGPYHQYLCFDLQVWFHGFISMLAFSALALFSTTVIKCLYPTVPDYLPGVGQTGALALISFLAAYVVNDQSVSFGQSTYHTDTVHETAAKRFVVHCTGRSGDIGTAAALGETGAEYGLKVEVPLALQDIVEKVIWVRARPATRVESGGRNRGGYDGNAAALVGAKE